MNEKLLYTQIIESLRKGIPPQRGVELYSVGHDKLIEGIKLYHLAGIGERGIIRFTSGSWGAGKTHFFRILRDVAFQNECLVASVELSVNSAALNKFESIFFGIIRNIATPRTDLNSNEVTPFRIVLLETLKFLGCGNRDHSGDLTHEDFTKAKSILMADHSIDIDFKKMVVKYWETFLPEAAEESALEQLRSEVLQWFGGEGSLGMFRKTHGVNKIVNKDNAKIMLQSLAGFTKCAGYKGLLILFDEAEQSYSVMRKSAVRDAQNNLLSLINNIEAIPGLFLIYATTPDFYTDPKHGIVGYGALAGRIGRPEDKAPRALDNIWNLNEVVINLADYQSAANKIVQIYQQAYGLPSDKLPNKEKIDLFVSELFRIHPSMSAIRFWRTLVAALVTHLDDHLEGDVRSTEKLYEDVMDRLRED
jgi:P-loop Domain of unknown function (DUF2791)